MVNVSTVTVESVPGSKFSVLVTCDEGGLVNFVVKGHVFPINVQHIVSDEVEEGIEEEAQDDEQEEEQEEADDHAAGPEEEEEEGEEPGQDINASFIRLLGLMLDRTYKNGSTAAFVYSLISNLTYPAFKVHFIARVVEEGAAWPSIKEMRVYYSLYLARHEGTGSYMDMIQRAREGEVEGGDNNEAFRLLLGLFLDEHHYREQGTDIVDGLPHNLTYPKFQTAYADAVQSLLEEAAQEGEEEGWKTTNEERGAYWQLYKALYGVNGKYMEMIQQARGGQVLAF